MANVAWVNGQPRVLDASSTPEQIAQLQAQGVVVTQVSDNDVTPDGRGGLMISTAALQQQQAFANWLQYTQALRAAEGTQINAYGAQTSRMSTENQQQQAMMNAALSLVGQPENYGKLANVVAGDPSAPYSALAGALAGMGHPTERQPDYSQLHAYSGKGASDFVNKLASQFGTQEGMTSAEKVQGGATPAIHGTTADPTTKGPSAPAQPTASSSPAGPVVYGSAMGRGVTPAGGGPGLTYSPEMGRWVPQQATTTPAMASGLPATFPNQGVSGVSQVQDRHQGQSAWEGRRDSLLGGQRHDDFQMAHGVTAQELNDVAKIGDEGQRRSAFQALAQRPAWTPATSHGSNWRATGDGGGNPYRHQSEGATFDYNGPAATSDRDRRARQAARAAVDPQRNRAIGGTDVMQKPPMFGAAAAGQLPDLGSPDAGMGGLPFDPHDPNPDPQNLQEIASILSSPPSPHPSALEAAVRECWSLGQDGQPQYTGHFADNAAQGTQGLPDGGLPAGPQGGELPIDSEGPLDLQSEPGGEPPPMPMGKGKPSMFSKMAEGGTMGGAQRGRFSTSYSTPDTAYSVPGMKGGAPISMSPTRARYSEAQDIWSATPRDPGMPGNARGINDMPADAAALAASVPDYTQPAFAGASSSAVGARPPRGASGAAAPRPHVGAAAPAPAPDPRSDERLMHQAARWYAAQFGVPVDEARKSLNATDAETQAYLKNALGMAQSGQIEQALGLETPTQASPNANVSTTSAEAKPAYTPNPMGRADAKVVEPYQRQGAGDMKGWAPGITDTPWAQQTLRAPDAPRADASKPTPAATPSPQNPQAPPQGGATEALQNVLSDLRRYYPSMSEDQVLEKVRGFLDTLAPGKTKMAAGGTTFVARKPTMFSAGGRPFEVGEGTRNGRPGADELVSVQPSPDGQVVVHVDPLQRRNTGVPPAVAATANLAVPGSPYHAKAGLPASPDMPGRWNSPDMPGTKPYGPQTVQNASPYGGVLVPDPNAPYRPFSGPDMVQDPSQRFNDAGDGANSWQGVRPMTPAEEAQARLSGKKGGRLGGMTGSGLENTVVTPWLPLNPSMNDATNGFGRPEPPSPHRGGWTGGGYPENDPRIAVPIPTGPGYPFLQEDPASRMNAPTNGPSAYGPMVKRAAGGTDVMRDDWRLQGQLAPAAVGQHGLPESVIVNGIRMTREPDGRYRPDVLPQPTQLAAGGTVRYGTPVAGAGVSVVRPGTQPSVTGQVTVPGAHGGTTTQPFFAAAPFPNPESAQSLTVDDMTPDDWTAFGMLTQQGHGMGVSQWQAKQLKARLATQNPMAAGAAVRPF